MEGRFIKLSKAHHLSYGCLHIIITITAMCAAGALALAAPSDDFSALMFCCCLRSDALHNSQVMRLEKQEGLQFT